MNEFDCASLFFRFDSIKVHYEDAPFFSSTVEEYVACEVVSGRCNRQASKQTGRQGE